MLRAIARLGTAAASRLFWSLILLELVFMGIASGAAAALARTPPPVDLTLPEQQTPAQVLTGARLPPELTIDRWFTMWSAAVDRHGAGPTADHAKGHAATLMAGMAKHIFG